MIKPCHIDFSWFPFHICNLISASWTPKQTFIILGPDWVARACWYKAGVPQRHTQARGNWNLKKFLANWTWDGLTWRFISVYLGSGLITDKIFSGKTIFLNKPYFMSTSTRRQYFRTLTNAGYDSSRFHQQQHVLIHLYNRKLLGVLRFSFDLFCWPK